MNIFELQSALSAINLKDVQKFAADLPSAIAEVQLLRQDVARLSKLLLEVSESISETGERLTQIELAYMGIKGRMDL